MVKKTKYDKHRFRRHVSMMLRNAVINDIAIRANVPPNTVVNFFSCRCHVCAEKAKQIARSIGYEVTESRPIYYTLRNAPKFGVPTVHIRYKHENDCSDEEEKKS